MRHTPSPNQIRGKRVAQYSNGRTATPGDTHGNAIYDPVIIFDDGSQLRFAAQESDGDPFVQPIYLPAPEKR